MIHARTAQALTTTNVRLANRDLIEISKTVYALVKRVIFRIQLQNFVSSVIILVLNARHLTPAPPVMTLITVRLLLINAFV
jgi:hypothetical protein